MTRGVLRRKRVRPKFSPWATPMRRLDCMMKWPHSPLVSAIFDQIRGDYLLAELLRPKPEYQDKFVIPLRLDTEVPEYIDPPPLPPEVRLTISRRVMYYPLDRRRGAL